MKIRCMLLILLFGFFSFSYAQNGYVFVLATKGTEGANVYLSGIHKEQEFKKCTKAKNLTECVRNSMVSYLMGKGERAFNFDYQVFPDEGTYPTKEDAESTRQKAISLVKEYNMKLEEITLTYFD